MAPSTARWSADNVSDIIVRGTIESPRTTARFSALATARIATSGGLMMALNSRTPKVPRLLIVKCRAAAFVLFKLWVRRA